MLCNMKEAIKVLFGGKNIVVITENDEKLGGKLICKPDGTFAVKKLDGKEIPIWLSSMRFIGLDGFEVIECKHADGKSSILLENGMPKETREALADLNNPAITQLTMLNDVLEKQHKADLGRLRHLDDLVEYWQNKCETYKKKNVSKPLESITSSVRIGDPFDIENITAAAIFNKGRSGPNRLFRRDPFEEFALLQQKSGAIGLFSDFWSVYRLA